MSKYHNIKTTVYGITFDSKKEAERYLELRMMEKAGKIKDLQLQPVFILQKGFTDGKGHKHRAITYRADFYYQENGKVIIEDVKGMETPVFKLKEKMLLYRYPEIDFRKVM